MTALAIFRTGALVRGRSTIVAMVVFAVATGLVTVLGLSSFRQVGLGSVGPAAAALVNLALLLPTAQGVLVGALTMTADRERGFGAMLRARGVRPAALVLTAWLAVTLSTWLSISAGFGVAAIIVAGNVPLDDLVTFTGIFGVALAAAAAATAVGVLIGSFAGTRLQAVLVGLAAWFMLAIGFDLIVIGLAAFLRLGEAAVVGAILVDPLTSARVAALLLLDAQAGVLGPTGAYLLGRLGSDGALLALVGVVLVWTAVPLAIASRGVVDSDG